MPETGQPIGEADYRATSDRMLEALAKLREVEEAKRLVPIASSEFIRLADLAFSLAGRVWSWANLQERLSHEAPGAVSRGDVAQQAIEAIEPRPSHLILADWREALTRLHAATPGSEAAAIASADAERFRGEFQEMSARRRSEYGSGRPGRTG